MPFPFIVIEGIDGTGKTTIAQLVAQQLHGAYFKTPVNFSRELRQKIDSLQPNPRFWHYHANLSQASKYIRALRKEQPVVCDRYYLSTFLYHQALGVETHKLTCFPPPHLEMPNITVYLWAEEHLLVERLTQRMGQDYDQHLESNRDLQQKVHALFMENAAHEKNMHVLDTGSYSSSEMPRLAAEVCAKCSLLTTL